MRLFNKLTNAQDMSVLTRKILRKVAKHEIIGCKSTFVTIKTTFSRTDALTMHCARLAKTTFVVKLSCMPKAEMTLRYSASL